MTGASSRPRFGCSAGVARSSGSSGRQGPDVYAAGDQMAQLAGAGFSARVTNHADASPTSTMCQNALMGSVSTG